MTASSGVSTTGPINTTSQRRNVGDFERALSAIGGGALALLALRRRGVSGLAMGIAGAELLRRGATGHCPLYEALGMSTADADTRDRAPVTGRAA